MAAHFADGGGGSTFATFVKISPAYTMHKDLGCSGKNGTSYESGGVGACATLCDNDSSCKNRRSPENEEECRAAVVAAGLEEGGCGPWDFAGAYGPGSFTFLSGTYASCGYWSTSGNPTGEGATKGCASRIRSVRRWPMVSLSTSIAVTALTAGWMVIHLSPTSTLVLQGAATGLARDAATSLLRVPKPAGRTATSTVVMQTAQTTITSTSTMPTRCSTSQHLCPHTGSSIRRAAARRRTRDTRPWPIAPPLARTPPAAPTLS